MQKTATKSKTTKKGDLKGKMSLPNLFLRSLFLGLFFILCLMGVVAGLMMFVDLSLGLIDGVGVVAMITGTMAAACWASSVWRQKGLLLGLGVGLCIYGVLFAISLSLSQEIGILALTKLMICLCSGAIGGIYGVNIRKVSRPS